jgi:peptide/nickel transport system substrate-binding protein
MLRLEVIEMKTLIRMQNVLIAVALGSFSPGFAAELPVMGGALRLGAKTDIAALNPFVMTASMEHNVRSLVFEALLMQSNSEPRPYLAESWKISEDGKRYEFRIKPGVRFHNGQDLTCEDVKWSIVYALDPKNRTYGRPEISMIQAVECAGARTLQIQLEESTASLLALLTSIQPFPIVSKGSITAGERPTAYPPGTGPFTLVEWRSGQRLVLKRFKDYWQKGIPRVDEMVIQLITDDTVRFTALRTGEVDMIDWLPYQYPERIRKQEIKDINLIPAAATGYRGLVFNVKAPPLDKLKVRQAIAYAIDKEQILKGARWGVGTVTNQRALPGSFWYFEFPDRERDQEKARRLLREAGISGRLKLKIFSTMANKDEVPFIQAQLGAVGIDLEPEILDYTTHNARQRTGEFELATTGGNVALDPHGNYYPWFHSEKGTRVRNISGYSNPHVDGLLDKGRVTVSPKERRKIYQEFLEIMHEEVPEISLGFVPNIYGARRHVRGFELEPQGRFFSGDKGLPVVWLER